MHILLSAQSHFFDMLCSSLKLQQTSPHLDLDLDLDWKAKIKDHNRFPKRFIPSPILFFRMHLQSRFASFIQLIIANRQRSHHLLLNLVHNLVALFLYLSYYTFDEIHDCLLVVY